MPLIRCPFCNFEKDVDEKLIPSSRVRVKCPKCQNTFDYASGDFVFTNSISEDELNLSQAKFRYAGFWIRFVAYIIDSLLLLILFAIPMIFLRQGFSPERIIERLHSGDFFVLLNISFFLITLLFIIIVSVGYYIISWSKWGKTIGMKILGIKVVNSEGKNISTGRAFLRWLMGYFLPGVIPYAGILLYLALAIMIGVDNKKQGWHDKIAGSYVVYEQ
ncbi:MAG: zinc-ribbon domain-containing protein [Proteobacteria bacterium]|nr:zinc-ribbon domain-containing protein [Pseudomonadota bacterium]